MGSRQVTVRAPFDGSEVGQCGDATSAEVERAIAAAYAARAAMAALPAWRRAQALSRLELALASAAEEVACLMSAEAGKPIRDARGEVTRARLTLRTAAEEAVRIGGEVSGLDVAAPGEGRFSIARRFPIGVIAGITPFNFPLNLVLHKLAPAIAAGNTIVVKASPRCPLTALRLAELAQALDLPRGAINILAGGAEPVRQLAADDRVAMISFTGSADVGWKLKADAGRKRVTLELGGNAANIVHRDADIELAAERLAAGGFAYAGQSCISVQRVYIHRDIYDKLRDQLIERAGKLRVGDPRDEATDVGPMITLEAAERAEAWIGAAIKAGARLACGGTRNGNQLTPAILEQVPPNAQIYAEEAFAPVMVLEPFDDTERVLAAANAGRYGLQAGVFTRDLDFALRAFQTLEVGAVLLNEVSSWRIDPMPYGGVKDSGFGREGLRSAIEEMTEPRLLLVRRSGK
ncbi:MAG TPA: aldehyde dehydrogenase family protein [Terriglobales bacterium]|nr:aldehyde dehydrogenase family protein [Terriglobales bacterium]